MKLRKATQRKMMATAVAAACLQLAGCASMRSFFALSKPGEGAGGPINNPFGDYYAGSKTDPGQNMVLRTRKGDRSVEIELPRASQEMNDFAIPVSPAFREGAAGRDPASVADPAYDESYKSQVPTYTDREITRSFPQSAAEHDGQRRDIEEELGLAPPEDSIPDNNVSYLAAIDHIKRLYKSARFEAALLATDGLLAQFPTDPRLYQMRGTLLDRVGQPEMAIKAWNQALRFDSKNQSLRRFIERREKNRKVASP